MIKEVMDALNAVCEPDFVVCEWEPSHRSNIDGKETLSMPYPTYDPLVDKLFELVFAQFPSIDPYQRLPEDPADKEPFDVLKTPESFESSTEAQIIRFLKLCRRGERFSDGLIEGAFHSGLMRAALERLKALSVDS